jgi:acetylornithine deacetylase
VFVPASSSAAQELLAKLVAFDTTSAKSNLELIDFIRDILASHGICATLTPSPDGTKASLFATIGPSDGKGGIGLSAHSDCVPVEGQTWTSDPFTLEDRDGKLYGRGSCDMKGFLACVLASLPLFTAGKLTEQIHIIVSYDEEVGCTGVRPLIARLGKDLPLPRIVVVGEPSNMTTIEAHKRIDAYRTVVTGKEAHSSLPQLGVNAISAAAELIEEIDRIGDVLAEGKNEHFDPPSSTIQVGTIEGGTAPNIVPKTCTFQWQVRSLPEADPGFGPKRLEAFARDRLLPAMRRVADGAAIDTQHLGYVPAFLAKPGSEAVGLALALTGANSTTTVSYGTEAGLFEEAGCPTVICGPGDIAQAHAADEFVTTAQLDACMAFLNKLAERLS